MKKRLPLWIEKAESKETILLLRPEKDNTEVQGGGVRRRRGAHRAIENECA